MTLFSSQIHRLPLVKKSLLPFIFISTLLSGCSSDFGFQSNMKPNNVEQYFSASQVKMFTDEGEFPANYQFIGLVEGDDCQTEPHLAPPSDINARTKARQSAYLKNANAIIFTSCVDIDTKLCVAQVVCYGKAYLIGDPELSLEQ